MELETVRELRWRLMTFNVGRSVDAWTRHYQYRLAVMSFRIGDYSAFKESMSNLVTEDSEAGVAFIDHAPSFRTSCYFLLFVGALEAYDVYSANRWMTMLEEHAPDSTHLTLATRLWDEWFSTASAHWKRQRFITGPIM